jgi:ribosomal protein L11
LPSWLLSVLLSGAFESGDTGLNCLTVEAAMNSVKGTARSMGVDVV